MSSTKKTEFSILRRPKITEKASHASAAGNCVVFEVHPDSNKVEIRAAVEKIFNVKVRAVRTVNYIGKIKRVGAKIGQQRDWKKAYISLEEGNSIDLVEGL